MTTEPDDEWQASEARLRGNRDEDHPESRLGRLLKARHAAALEQDDQVARSRVWHRIASTISAGTAQPAHLAKRSASTRWAQAAALVGVGLLAGWFARTPVDQSRVEFTFGEFERSRGGTREIAVERVAPREVMHTLTSLLIVQNVPFELYSTNDPRRYRIVFSIPEHPSEELAAMLGDLNAAGHAGESISLTLEPDASAQRTP